MSNPKIALKVHRPLSLSTQVKTFGNHVAIPMDKADVYKAVASPNEVIAVDDQGEETEVTFDNLDELFPDDEDNNDNLSPVSMAVEKIKDKITNTVTEATGEKIAEVVEETASKVKENIKSTISTINLNKKK